MVYNTLETTLAETEDQLALETFELRQLYKADVARAFDLISFDSGLFPERYLVDSFVPYGGE